MLGQQFYHESIMNVIVAFGTMFTTLTASTGVFVPYPTATADNTLTIDFGTSAGGAEFVAAVQVNATSTGLALGTSASVLAGNKAVGSGNVFAGFVDGVKLYDTAAEVVHMRLAIGGAALDTAAGRIRQFVKYIVIS